MKVRNSMAILMVVGVVVLLLLPTPTGALHDPPGTQANSGTVYSGSSKMLALVDEGYDTYVWNVYDDEYKGDFDFKGVCRAIGSHVLDMYVVIKIKPADSSHKHLMILTDFDFYYGISAGFLSSAVWTMMYVVLDLSEDPIPRGWSKFSLGDSVFQTYKNYQHKGGPLGFWILYDDLFYTDYYEFSTTKWYYVGIWLRANLAGHADFYKTAWQSGYADWDTHYIKWSFF